MPTASRSVSLSETDRASLQIFVHRGRANARTLTRARILRQRWPRAGARPSFAPPSMFAAIQSCGCASGIWRADWKRSYRTSAN